MTQGCNCHGANKRHTEMSVGLLERPRYSPGLILEDSDLTAAVDYTRNLNRLLFRSLFGCGVVCGLDIGLGFDCGVQVTVSPGLALDGCGDPLQLTGPVTLDLGRRDGVLPAPGAAGPPDKKDFWVIACGQEKLCGLREVVCDGDNLDGARQPTRSRAATEIQISFTPPRCVCGCMRFPEGDEPGGLAEAADQLLPQQGENGNGEGDDEPADPCGHDPHGCHEAHYRVPGCAADCGCGTACACGCCVLLGWVHWFEGAGWGVLHDGVRRFVRPCLIADTIKDKRPAVRGQREPEEPEQPAPTEGTQPSRPRR